MFKLLKYFKWQEWVLIFFCLGLIVLQVWVELKLPHYTGELTELIQPNAIAQKNSMNKVWEVGGYMLACALGSLCISILISFISSKVTAKLSYRVREAIYNKVEAFSMEEIKKFSTASLITRTTNDITQVGLTFNLALQLLVRAPVMAIWCITIIAEKSWQWSIALIVAVVILICILMVVIFLAIPKFKRIQKLTDNLNSVTRENLTGLRVVRAYNAEDYQEKKFDKANTELTKTNLFASRAMAIMSPGMTLISNGLALAIYWIGAFLIDNATLLNKGILYNDMIIYMAYAMQIVMSFIMLIMIFMMLPRASVSAKRINEVLDTMPNILDGNLSKEQIKEINEKNQGIVEFRNVSFKYPDAEEYVVKNVSFTAKKGQTIAFIGSTGSGKSTLINLIPRFYDASEGEILIDGVNIKDYSQQDLHNKIGYVPQKAVLFAGTIESNLNFGDNGKEKISEEDLNNSAQIAQASEFIENLPDKFNSRVAQGGTNFSGGQKQRLAIARAIAREPEIFIFDDSFSALDYKTDRKLRSELKQKTANAISFIVAQRIGTIKDADQIIVLEEGNVVGIGKHKQLLKDCEIYREIALSQLSKEELEKND